MVSDTTVQFSDTLGNHNLTLTTYTISSYESYLLSYLNRKNRAQWGAYILAEQSFFTDYFSDGFRVSVERLERRYKDNNAIAFMRYPISLYSRIEVGGGLVDRDYITLQELVIDDDGNVIRNPDGTPDTSAEGRVVRTGRVADYTEGSLSLGFSRDTVKYAPHGPQQGMMFDLDYNLIMNQADTYSIDFRAYKEVSRRSLLAARIMGNYSDGDAPTLFTLGGRNDLRGDYDYQEFIGSRRFLAQGEYRFPLIDILRFPGITFGNIRGLFFLDVGASWVNDDRFSFEFQSDDDGYDAAVLEALEVGTT